jgi:hypothetical protein
MVNLVFEGNKKLGGFYGCDEDSDENVVLMLLLNAFKSSSTFFIQFLIAGLCSIFFHLVYPVF